MRLSPSFLLKFFAFAGLFFALWSFAGVGDAYGRAVVRIAKPLIELTTECKVTAVKPTEMGLDVLLTRSDPDTGKVYERKMPLQPREVFSGAIPFLALMLASARMSLRQRASRTGLGMAILVVFHIGLMLIGPYLTGLPQAHLSDGARKTVHTVVNVIYGFYGLVGYAALPFLLWFWLKGTQDKTSAE